MFDYKKLIRNRELRIKLVNCLRFIPSKPYLKIAFWMKSGKHLNLKNPVTYCDKLNWLKLHDIRPEYTQMADKIAVRAYVKEILGQDICFPLLGAWSHYDEIDFDALPSKFVLKCSHDSGSTTVVTDKSKLDHAKLRQFYEGRLKVNAYVLAREYPYREIPPRICAEQYMIPDGESDINDYKFFCFSGKPEILFVATERSTDCRFDFFDMEFNHLDIENIHPKSDSIISKPEKFEDMKKLAEKLSQGTKFVRIDLYEINGTIYFGEFTFFHAGGFWPMKPYEWEYKLGDLIDIS